MWNLVGAKGDVGPVDEGVTLYGFIRREIRNVAIIDRRLVSTNVEVIAEAEE